MRTAASGRSAATGPRRYVPNGLHAGEQDRPDVARRPAQWKRIKGGSTLAHGFHRRDQRDAHP